MPHVGVHIISAFSGPRHSTLEFLWDVTAEFHKEDMRLNVFRNPGAKLSHADCYREMWKQALAAPERFALFTEFDLLPKICGFLPTGLLTADKPIAVAEYVTRNPSTGRLIHHGIPGGWYVLIDKTHVRDPARPPIFAPGGAFNDPCNILESCLQRDYQKSVTYLNQADAMPRHYGTLMHTGEHLFWSRHYNDPPTGIVAGFPLSDILPKVDKAIVDWVKSTPTAFQTLLLRRAACVRSE